MSLNDYLNSLSTARQEEARRAFADLPEPEGQLDDLFEEAAYERSVALDPEGARISRLVLRLYGDEAADASLDDATAEHVIGAFGREVKAASGDSADARMRLVGFSAGSVVLHFEPARAELNVGADGAIAVWSAADHAVEVVLDLHRAIESKIPAAEIQSRFKQPGLLSSVRRFLEVLDKHSLDMSTRWYGPTGNISGSKVTSAGREYALNTLFAKVPDSQREIISGHVTVLDADGFVTVKAIGRKPKVKVPVERITDGSFAIGQFVQINATRFFLSDKVGITGDPSFEFISFLDADGTAPLPGLPDRNGHES